MTKNKLPIELTPEQQKDIIVALMTGAPGLVKLNSVELNTYNPAFVLFETEHHSIRYTMSAYGKGYSFLLNISHFSQATQLNPETISIFRFGEGESPERWELRGLGYVIDRLREYGIWVEASGEKKKRLPENGLVTDLKSKEIANFQINNRLSESGISGSLLDGARCTDAFDHLATITGDLGRAIVLFDAVLDQAKSLHKSASWVVDELNFEIHVEVIEPGRREALARSILESAGDLSDQLLDQYNERLTRFKYGKEE